MPLPVRPHVSAAAWRHITSSVPNRPGSREQRDPPQPLPRVADRTRADRRSTGTDCRDDGVGIEDRANAAGMGLSIMDYRAKALGGVLTCTPRRSGGTTVRCVFPLEVPVKARRADAQQSRSA